MWKSLMLAKIEHKQTLEFEYIDVFIAVLKCTVKVSGLHAPYGR